MRIAVFHDLPSGGAKRVLQAQLRGLGERGHELLLFVPASADESFLPTAPFVRQVTTLPLPAPPDRARVLEGRPAPLDPLRWLAYLGRVHAAARKLAAAIDDAACDVVLVHPSQFTQGPWVLRWLRTPTMYYCHEPLRAAYDPFVTTAWMRLLIRASLGRIDRRNVRAAGRVLANSRFTAEAVRAIYDVPAAVAYPGIDAERFRPVNGIERQGLLTVGALLRIKGLDFIVRALGRIPAAERPPLTVIADRGRAAERARLDRLASRSGVDLRLRTRVDDDALIDAYARASIVLYAARNEPLGLVPLEAMACGRPVVAVADGGVVETVQDGVTGVLVPRDEERFAHAVAGLLRDPERADELGRNGLAMVRRDWTWEGAVDTLERELAALAYGEKR
ncbi:MAG TPA: glycosyltransferase family 4 protein [Longimicrobiales bacterium]|nr:glycosyltransferase family 4 protein [Longimicrobiales bacterium]